jgi:hypothetical protein
MSARRAFAWVAIGVSTLGGSSAAWADQTAPKQITCLEKIPQGAKRPTVEERFPGEVVAGYEATLELEIRHGKGETPLASGFRLSSGSDVEKALKAAGFLVADPDAGADFDVETESDGDRALTKARIPIIVAPNESGTRSLILPEMPIPISRANGETMTVCTRVHLVTVTDPTAGEEDPKPRPNSPPRPQIEPWPLMKWILLGIVLALVVLAITIQWIRKQLALAAPNPEATRRLPWEEALLELAALRASPLYDERSGAGPVRAELFDRTSDTVRKYLGARYGFEGLGFDGLETTTGEMMTLLARVRPGVPRIDLVRRFLDECDLVKFAKVDPSIADCDEALRRAETIVRVTTPLASNATPEPPEQGRGHGQEPAPTPRPPPDTPSPFAGGPS